MYFSFCSFIMVEGGGSGNQGRGGGRGRVIKYTRNKNENKTKRLKKQKENEKNTQENVFRMISWLIKIMNKKDKIWWAKIKL